MQAISYNELGDLQLEGLRAAIADAFIRPELEALLEGQQAKAWRHVEAEGAFEDRVLAFLKTSRRQGWTDQIVAKIKVERRNQRSIARLDVTLGLMAPVRPTTTELSDESVLQRLITTKDNIVDVSKYSEVQARICRIDRRGKPVGTGFLIANDLVLTNYHVVENLRADNALCRFDLRTQAGGGEGPTRDVRFAEDWRVDHLGYAPGDEKLDGRAPNADELDFAVVRLAEPVGLDLVHGMRRGAIPLASTPALDQGSLVQIIQHASGSPLAMSIGEVTGYHADGLRLRYEADTLPGSSGSPVFARDLSIVALHHAGDPDWGRKAEFNQGIPIGLLQQRLLERRILAQGGAAGIAPAQKQGKEAPQKTAPNPAPCDLAQPPAGAPAGTGGPPSLTAPSDKAAASPPAADCEATQSSPPPASPPHDQKQASPPAATIVILGEPRPPVPAGTEATRAALLQALRQRNAPLEPAGASDWPAAWNQIWGDGWRTKTPLERAQTMALLARRPVFVRTLMDATRAPPRELNDLTYQLHHRLGLEMDNDTDPEAGLLQQCPRILWRPGAPPSEWEPAAPAQLSAQPTDVFARHLAELLGLPEAQPETVIHCAHAADAAGHELEIQDAVERGLVDAVGADPEPDRRVFAPSNLRNVLQKLSGPGLRLLALNDMSVPQPATRDKAVEVFRGFDQDIDGSVGSRRDLIRVAVLVHTADEFAGEVLFNSKARLQNWLLLRIPKGPDGSYQSADIANIAFIKQRVASIRNGKGRTSAPELRR